MRENKLNMMSKTYLFNLYSIALLFQNMNAVI